MEIKYKNNPKSRSNDITSGVLMILIGIIVMLVMLIRGISVGQDYMPKFLLCFFMGGFSGLTWIIAGFSLFIRVGKIKMYKKILGNTKRFRIPALSFTANKRLDRLSLELLPLLNRGYLGDCVLDLSDKQLIFDKDSKPLLAPQGEPDTIYEQHRKLPMAFLFVVFSTFLTVAVFIEQSLSLTFVQWIITAVVTALVAIWMGISFPAPAFLTEIERPISKPKPVEKTGIDELDEMLKSVSEQHVELERLQRAIRTPKINGPLSECIKILDDIVDYLKEHKEKMKSLREFMNYYLPTTINLLKTYEDLMNRDNKGENITTGMKEIEEMMNKVVNVFKREYDELFMDRVMDISAEVAVMKNMIEQSDIDKPFQ